MKEGAVHRIEQIRIANDLNNSELEKKLGMSNGSWDKAVSRNSSIKDDILRKVLEVFPETNIKWLLMGEGEMKEADIHDPEELAKYIAKNHEELFKRSELYREKMLNIGMEVFMRKYGHLLTKQD